VWTTLRNSSKAAWATPRYYKLKKPLRGEGFDFTTPGARRRNAEAEVRLNRRLAGDVYVPGRRSALLTPNWRGCEGFDNAWL
jgi:aminoglycoside phosphotransferase family enzyme